MKKKKFERVPNKMLKALGFTKLTKRGRHYVPEATHYHSTLNFYYTPKWHTLQSFMRFYVSEVVQQMLSRTFDELRTKMDSRVTEIVIRKADDNEPSIDDESR